MDPKNPSSPLIPINKVPQKNYSTIDLIRLATSSSSSISKSSSTGETSSSLSSSSSSKIIIEKIKKLKSKESIRILCPNCQKIVMTQTNYVNGNLTYLICILCALGCWCGLLPLIINDFKDIEHKCPKCNTLIGKRFLADS